MRTPEAGPTDRAICAVGDIDVHYLRHGAGAPVLVLHDSPGSATSLTDLVLEVAEAGTVVAPDLPGHGGSGPFDQRRELLAVDDLAELVHRFAGLVIDAPYVVVGLGRVGGALAARLAEADPDRVAGVVLQAEPGGDRPPAAQWPTDLDLTPHWDGTHLVRLFHAARDRYLYRGTGVRTAATRVRATLPDPWTLHSDVMDVLERGTGAPVLAVGTLDHGDAADGPSTPTAVSGRAVGRWQPGEPDLQWEVAGPQRALADLIGDLSKTADTAGTGGPVRMDRAAELSNDRMARRVVAAVAPDGDRPVHLLVRSIGSGPPVVLFHPSPGSAAHLEPLMRAWAGHRTVIAIDNPGQGYSDHPARADLGLYVELTRSVLEQLDLVGVDVWGSHTGAKVALELAVRYPDYVRRLILDGIGMYSAAEIEEFRTQYIHPMVPDRHGTHLLEAWHERRDMYLFFPWYRQTAENARTTHPRDVAELHAEALEFFRSGPTFHHAYWAALSYPAARALAAVACPTLLCVAPTDPLKRYLDDARVAQPNLSTLELPDRTSSDGMARCVALFESFFTADIPKEP